MGTSMNGRSHEHEDRLPEFPGAGPYPPSGPRPGSASGMERMPGRLGFLRPHREPGTDRRPCTRGEEIGGAGQHVPPVAGQAQAYLSCPSRVPGALGQHYADHAILPSPAKTVSRSSRGRQKPTTVTGWAGWACLLPGHFTGVEVTALRLMRNEKPPGVPWRRGWM